MRYVSAHFGRGRVTATEASQESGAGLANPFQFALQPWRPTPIPRPQGGMSADENREGNANILDLKVWALPMSPLLQSIYTVWGIWIVTWLAAAVWSARTEARPGGLRGLPYYFFTFIGGAMLFGSVQQEPAYQLPSEAGPVLLGLTVLGFVFAWWARLHLGALWSGTVTKKANHHVIDTGPYRLVRHPIYTGIILASFATAAAKATPIAFAGAFTMAFGWYLKARLEERFLREELGADAYGAYAQRVPMLVPFL